VDILEEFEMRESIGTGKFSKVYRAVEIKTDKSYAMKVVDKEELNLLEKEMLRAELSILQNIQHPNIPNVIRIAESVDHAYIISHLLPDGELFHYLNKHKRLPGIALIEISNLFNFYQKMKQQLSCTICLKQ
jgi:serine/threonine protein kinase